MNSISQLLNTEKKERSSRFNPQDAFVQAFSQTMMVADALERLDHSKAEKLTREQTASMARLLTGAAAAAVALDEWKKNHPMT